MFKNLEVIKFGPLGSKFQLEKNEKLMHNEELVPSEIVRNHKRMRSNKVKSNI
jgi:hypothetical protein